MTALAAHAVASPLDDARVQLRAATAAMAVERVAQAHLQRGLYP